MTEKTQEKPKVVRQRKPKPTYIVGSLTDANGNPVDGVVLNVVAVTKDEGEFARLLKAQFENPVPGFKYFEVPA